MTALYSAIDPGGLLEYSVVYTDRAMNHMSRNFQGVMQEVSRVLRAAGLLGWRPWRASSPPDAAVS